MLRANFLQALGFISAFAVCIFALRFELQAWKELAAYSAASVVLLLGGLRLFVTFAFGLRGALVVAFCIFVLYWQMETASHLAVSIVLAGLWALVPFLFASALESSLQLQYDLRRLKQRHLILFAATDSFAIFILLVLSLGLASENLRLSLSVATFGSFVNFLSILLMIAVVQSVIKLYRLLFHD